MLRSHNRRIRKAFAAAILLLLSLGFAACAATIPPPHPTAADEGRARIRWPGTTLATLQQGRSLFVERCAGCHSLPSPSAHSAADWPGLLGEMADKARLEGPDREAVLQYLVTMAEVAPAPAAAR
jgi:hypothetical protein